MAISWPSKKFLWRDYIMKLFYIDVILFDAISWRTLIEESTLRISSESLAFRLISILAKQIYSSSVVHKLHLFAVDD